MRKLLIAAVVLLILGVAADFAAARVFEDRVTTELQREYDLGRRPVVQVRDFPFLPHLATGRFSTIDVAATGLKPGSAYRISVHSTPRTLAQGIVPDDGTVASSVSLPLELEPGAHHIVFEGEALSGEPAVGRYGFEIDAHGILLATDDVPLLEKKGSEAAPYLWVGAAVSSVLTLAVLASTSALRRRRRRARIQRRIEELENTPLITHLPGPPRRAPSGGGVLQSTDAPPTDELDRARVRARPSG